MHTIYRIENSEGNGPYHTLLSEEQAEVGIYTHNASSNHPTISYDVGLINILGMHKLDVDGSNSISEDYRFGFISLEQLNTWFTQSQIDGLKTKGFEIKQYNTDDFFFSAYQCIFRKKSNG